MICQQCGFAHKTQFLVCPECSTYQFRETSSFTSLLVSFILASLVFGLTLFAVKVGGGSGESKGFAFIITSHWINSTILLVSYWAIFLILGKLLDYLKQRKVLEIFLDAKIMSLLSKKGTLSPDNFHNTIHEIRNELIERGCRDVTDYIIFDLIRKTLYHLESVQQKEEINNILSYHAQISHSKMEESFTMLKVFYWAIPILGFIGTVLGIGVAIGAFSTFVSAGSDSAGLKNSLVEVSKGLSVAFDSTLIALAFAVILLPVGTFVENLFINLITQSEEYALSFITPNMDFPIDEKSPNGILRRNVEALSIQSKYLQDFVVEFTTLCNRLNDNGVFGSKSDSEIVHSDGEITEEVMESGTGVLPEGVLNTDAYPTEVIKAVSDSEIMNYEDKEHEKVVAPPIMADDQENEATILESLIAEKDDQLKNNGDDKPKT
jgi:biopolymer transport protein ExbB/TolQ